MWPMTVDALDKEDEPPATGHITIRPGSAS